MTHVTTYLNGFSNLARSFRQSSMMLVHQVFTLSLLYCALPKFLVIAFFTMSFTCSLTNSFSPSSSMPQNGLDSLDPVSD